MQKIRLTITLVLSCYAFAKAQETYSLMFYNLLNYPSAPPTNRAQLLFDILDQSRPDIFMVCELESNSAAGEILDISLNGQGTIYDSADFVDNTSSGADLQQLIYWNASKFSLEATDIIPTSVRDINRYRLKVTATENLENVQYIEVFVTHLKASQGASNEQLRLSMVEEFLAYLPNLDPDDTVVFAGDFNLYSSDEPAYQVLLNGSNDIQIIDPIDAPGDWNNNPEFAYLHTQSTRTSNNDFDDFGAGGGMDSRFDFIMLSENTLNDEHPLTYVEGSYEAFGNNGNCFNRNINDEDCTGTYSTALRELLYTMSDHTPVIAQLQLNEENLSTTAYHREPLLYFPEGNIVRQTSLRVSFDTSKPLPKELEVYDQLGRLLQRIHVSSHLGTIIETAGLSSGVYYLRHSESNKPKKFIISL